MQIHRTLIETDDLDAYPALERAMGWTSEKTQLSEGRGFYRFIMVTIGELSIWRYEASTDVYHSYETLHDTFDFVFFRQSEGTIWCGRELPHAANLVHHPGNSYWAKTRAGTIIHGLFLPEHQARSWELAPDELLTSKASPEVSVFLGTDVDINRLLDRLDATLDLNDDELHCDDLDVNGIRADIIASLHRFLDASVFVDGTTGSVKERTRRTLFDKARNLIADRLDGPLSSADVAETLWVSRRLLELSFRDALGVSPYQFILNQKLHAARRTLSEGAGTVREVCDRFGFVNAGRFAKMYKQLFGEQPSQTLRRAALKSNLVNA